MMIKSIPFLWLILSLLLVVSGCTPAAPPATTPTAPTAASLAGTSWQLVSLGDPAAPQPALPDTRPTLMFDEQMISGSTGCNEYSANYNVSGSSLTFEPIVQTERACLDPGVMEQERLYTTFLGAAETFTREGDTLTLTGSVGVLVFGPHAE